MPETDLNRVDFQEYFLMWNSVLHYPNPAAEAPQMIHGYRGDLGTIPCHQHKTCGALVHATVKYPPRVCPGCQKDTQAEFKEKNTHFEASPVNTGGAVILND